MRENTGAVLVHTAANTWELRSGDETKVLALIQGNERFVLGPARATLIADHGYPAGVWCASGPGRYNYHHEAEAGSV